MTNAEGWKKELQIRGTLWDIKRSSIQFEINISQRFSMFDNAYLVAELCWGRWFQLHEVSIPLARGLKFNSWQRIVLWPCPINSLFSYFFQVWVFFRGQGDDRPSVMATRTSRIDCYIDTIWEPTTTHELTPWMEKVRTKKVSFRDASSALKVLSCFRWVFL